MKRPPFIPFDELRAVRIYQKALPHWQQDGATYFVTFRLGDSVPAHVSRGWDDERRRWIAARDPTFSDHSDVASAVARLSAVAQSKYHKHFNRKFQEYLDSGIGECHLRHKGCIEIMRHHILKHDGAACHVGDFVIMPNHVHVLLTPVSGERLEGILRNIKGASSYDCHVALGRSGRFWQPESYDHIVRTLDQLQAYREYIAGNPEKAGIAIDPLAIYRAEWLDEWFL
jgi:type I restriction enzyme R subunit